MSDDILNQQENENYRDYLIRLFNNKSTYNINNDDIAKLLNSSLGTNYGESKFRKQFAAYQEWKDYIINKNLDQEIIDKYETIKLEAEKEKIRKQDQKREYKKLVRNSARFEQLQDEIILSIHKLSKEKPLNFSPLSSFVDSSSEKQGLALFSDWHFGAEVNNSINKFNKEIFNKRVEYLVNKIIEYGTDNHISMLNASFLGDFVHGLIHISARVQSNEDMIQQIIYVSEVISNVIAKLASIFPFVKTYFVNGNHSRPPGAKDEFGMNENFELLIPWYIKARLQDLDNVEFITERDGYILTSIFDKQIVFVHGQYDSPDSSVNKLPQMLGILPDYIMSGHIHHSQEREYSHTEVIVNSSLIGVDDYSVSKRFGTKPSQKFMVFDKNIGLESTYKIDLSLF